MTRRVRSRFVGIGIALATAAIAAIINGLLWPDFGNRYPLIGFYPAIVFTAFVAGAWPGILCTVAASVIAAFVWLDPHLSPHVSRATDAVALTVFAAVGALISALTDLSVRRAVRERASRERAERAEHELADELADARRLQQLTTSVFRCRDPLAILRDLIDSTSELLNAGAVHVYLHDEASNVLKLADCTDGSMITSADRVEAVGTGPILDACRLRRRIVFESGPPGGAKTPESEASPLITADGKVLGVLTVRAARTPITERRRRIVDVWLQQAAQALERCRLLERECTARREAEEANRLKDVFLSTVSHELRTPLNAVLGWAEMLRTGQLPPAAHQRALAVISDNAHRQKQLVDDLLDVARITSGTLRIEPSDIVVIDIVRKAIDVIEPAARAKGLHLTIDAADVRCRVDADRLQQILWNLLTNAVKFTPAGGLIEVGVAKGDQGVEIRVRDTGMGIPVAFLPHVFEPFRQADAAPTRSQSGVGLGLSIVKHLVEAHGGTIRAESRGEGLGACFTVTLPTSDNAVPVA